MLSPPKGRTAVKLGLHYWNYSIPSDPAEMAATLSETARIADEAGFSGFSVMDHYFQMEHAGSAAEPMLEAYTTLGHVAARTERMTLGVLVTGVMYRHPGLLAKIVTTLDVLSGGRGRLGVGASWYEREQVGLGVPVVPVAERFERLEETLQICLQMWSDDNGPFNGRHYQLAETLCVPQPLSRPHPPILVGGGGEKKTLLLVARYADACNVFGSSPADVAGKLDVLRSHCEAEGRDYDRIEKTVLAVIPALADVDAFLAAAREYAALGVTELAVMPDRHPVEFAEQIAERVLPGLAGM
jgi:F420-dependent oxidoreductase-like protein